MDNFNEIYKNKLNIYIYLIIFYIYLLLIILLYSLKL